MEVTGGATANGSSTRTLKVGTDPQSAKKKNHQMKSNYFLEGHRMDAPPGGCPPAQLGLTGLCQDGPALCSRVPGDLSTEHCDCRLSKDRTEPDFSRVLGGDLERRLRG